MSLLGAGVDNIIFVIGATGWVTVCRLMQAQLLTLREQEFVTAARAIGAGDGRIALFHLLPNALAPIIVAVTLAIPLAIFAEAGLNFLGIGINEPTPSLGKMVADSAPYIRVYWHLGLFPTIAIALIMLGFSFVGDGLRDALDPRLSPDPKRKAHDVARAPGTRLDRRVQVYGCPLPADLVSDPLVRLTKDFELVPGAAVRATSVARSANPGFGKQLLAEAGFPDGEGFPAQEMWLRAPAPADTAVATGLVPISPEPDPDDWSWFARMVACPLPPVDAPVLKRRLYDEHRIEVPLSIWSGGPPLRVSVQGYNTRDDVATLLAALDRLLPAAA